MKFSMNHGAKKCYKMTKKIYQSAKEKSFNYKKATKATTELQKNYKRAKKLQKYTKILQKKRL